MRVAFDARHAGRGLGIATFLSRLAGELAALAEISLVWLGDPALAPAGTSARVPVHRLPYPVLDGPAGRALVRRLDIDVMHFTGNTGWGRPGPVPYVLTLHDLIFLQRARAGRSLRQTLGHPYERRLITRALSAADVLTVPSRTVADDVERTFGTTTPAHVVYEGVVPPAGFVPAPAEAAGRDEPAYLVAFAGRDPRKRTAEVVAGWRALAPTPVRLRLLAAAGLPADLRDGLGPELASGAVEVLSRVTEVELWRILSRALALAYPSSDEGFGLPVLEGMAAGTPVLSGLAPATREIGGDAILALDATDVPGSIAAAVRRLEAEPGLRAEIVRRGRQRAAAFTWHRTAERYVELYRTAIASRT